MPKAITQDRNGLGYPVSIYYLYVNHDEAYEVYAVSVEDAFECLFENEPKVSLDDIILVKEHKCPAKKRHCKLICQKLLTFLK